MPVNAAGTLSYPTPIQQALDSGRWVVLGTDCCTLCDLVAQMLLSLQMARPIKVLTLDIMDLAPETYLHYFHRIPVIITHTSELNWPFNLVELISRYDGEQLRW